MSTCLRDKQTLQIERSQFRCLDALCLTVLQCEVSAALDEEDLDEQQLIIELLNLADELRNERQCVRVLLELDEQSGESRLQSLLQEGALLLLAPRNRLLHNLNLHRLDAGTGLLHLLVRRGLSGGLQRGGVASAQLGRRDHAVNQCAHDLCRARLGDAREEWPNVDEETLQLCPLSLLGVERSESRDALLLHLDERVGRVLLGQNRVVQRRGLGRVHVLDRYGLVEGGVLKLG